jgi:myo-inositol-1(or 4)-monophosphatase
MQDYLRFISETASEAGKLTLEYFRSDLEVERKGDDTPVTQADRATEEFIRTRISERFPDHFILGEEFGETKSLGTSHRWIIDPIDGTKAFMRGVPLYGVLIGLEVDGEVVAGAACFPALGELVAAAIGEGCWWNGERVQVADTAKIKDATVLFGDPNNFEVYGRAGIWDRLRHTARFSAGWGDAYGHALVATGRADAMLDPVMHIWDCGPFPPILGEAGGYFGDWSGNITIEGNEAISTTSNLLPELLDFIRAE